jgi:hypothetical protein
MEFLPVDKATVATELVSHLIPELLHGSDYGGLGFVVVNSHELFVTDFEMGDCVAQEHYSLLIVPKVKPSFLKSST